MMRGEIIGRGCSGVGQEKQGWRKQGCRGSNPGLSARARPKKGRPRSVLGGTGQLPGLPRLKKPPKPADFGGFSHIGCNFLKARLDGRRSYFSSFSVKALRWLSRPSAPPVATDWAKSERRVVSWLTPS